MTQLLPSWPLLSAFLLASLVLAVTPGPGVLYIVTRSLSQGRRCGLVSVAGVAAGNLGNALAASIGLATLFSISSTAFVVIKYAGAAYLIYLGVLELGSTNQSVSADGQRRDDLAGIFRDAFVVALLNPKTTLFFAAFLPQFLGAGATPILQTAALGSLFVAIAAFTDSIYAVAAGSVASALARSNGIRMLGRYLSGGVFVALGVLAALTGGRDGN